HLDRDVPRPRADDTRDLDALAEADVVGPHRPREIRAEDADALRGGTGLHGAHARAEDDRIGRHPRERHVDARFVVPAGEPAAPHLLPVALDEEDLAPIVRTSAPLIAGEDERLAAAGHRFAGAR